MSLESAIPYLFLAVGDLIISSYSMAIDLYPIIIHDGDLSPDAFGTDVDDICEEIHQACKGFGTNEE